MEMLQCYNRGCGKTYDPDNNNDDSCCHHPGAPFFHDAYKGWSCCNKKSVDFTEFLNTKGCTLSKHSNVKPPEPEKPDKSMDIPVEEEIRPPIKKEIVKRPDFNTPLTEIVPTVAPALKEAIDTLKIKAFSPVDEKTLRPGEIPVGTSCKNRGCSQSYSESTTGLDNCLHHPGVPIFHEGMKYWSCCQKKTTDFSAFMAQAGCTTGTHKWFKDDDDKKVINCRYDWHQTATTVTVAIYAKMYHYEKSSIKVNPIRLKVSLVFPDQNDAEFNLDIELRGLIQPKSTSVHMYGTKVEITLIKAEPGSWPKLDFPLTKSTSEVSRTPKKLDKLKASSSSDSDSDLDDIEPLSSTVKLTDIS